MPSNYSGAKRSFTDGLATPPLGDVDHRSLRFVGAAERAAGANTAHGEHPATLPEEPIAASDLRAIGSYNWLAESETPTILIPGSPPIWLDSASSGYKLRPDTKIFGTRPIFVDHGACDGQQTVLLALAAAVQECTPNFIWSDADVVADRNTLRNLLRWVEREDPRKLKDFRADAHLAGHSTLVFTRWEERIVVRASKGSFGFSFERAQTRPAPGCEVARNTGRTRVISYDFGGLRLVVASKVDACLRASHAPPAHTTAPQDGNFGPLPFRRAGTLAPQDELVELAARTRNSASRGHAELLRQLWLSQIPHFVLAVHEDGVVQELRRQHLHDSPALRAAADAAQGGLKRLRVLLDAVRRLVVERGRDTRLSLLCREGRLEVFVREGAPVLPAEFEDKFL